MLSDNLYRKMLLEPVRHDPSLDELYIVSGYSTSAMAFHHLNESMNVKVKLICGMTVSDGISLGNHKGFCKLVNEDFSERFECSYIYKGIPVHAKLYIWCSGLKPKYAFLGSANYTQSALRLSRRRELMIPCPPKDAFDYYQALVDDSIFCNHGDTSELICFYADEKQKTTIKEAADATQEIDYSGLPHIRVSLLANDGSLPQRSGLNWGQRPEYHRNPNQAYIRLPASIYKTDFFPPREVHFTVLTDDAKTIVCSRAQENAKAIHTPHNNSLIGEYFRNRLGLSEGAPVTLNDLSRYGRTDIDFYKIDDETYYLDFSI